MPRGRWQQNPSLRLKISESGIQEQKTDNYDNSGENRHNE